MSHDSERDMQIWCPEVKTSTPGRTFELSEHFVVITANTVVVKMQRLSWPNGLHEVVG